MRWHNCPPELFGFTLAWDMVGVSFDEVSDYLRENGPVGFQLKHALAPLDQSDHFAQWGHHVDSHWPGNYASLWMRYSDRDRKLHVQIEATHNNVAYPEGLRFLAGLLKFSQSALRDVSIWLIGDGYGATLSQQLSREQLDLLLTDVKVEIDSRINEPWDHMVLYLRLEFPGKNLFLRRLAAKHQPRFAGQ